LITWYARYYGKQYAESVRNITTPEHSEADIEFVLKETGLTPPARIADIPCGSGRHSLALAQRGFSVFGLDLNEEFIAAAQHQVSAKYPAAQFVAGDMRNASGGPYDAMLCLYHSFGFFSDSENWQFIQTWGELIKPGGFFVLDIWNRDRILSQPEPERTWQASDELQVTEQRAFDPLTGRATIHYIYTYANGEQYTYDASHRLYTFTEIRDLFSQAGLALHSVYGSLSGEPYTLDSRRLVVFGRKNG
jgi:SAM-dependent methyltransferase